MLGGSPFLPCLEICSLVFSHIYMIWLCSFDLEHAQLFFQLITKCFFLMKKQLFFSLIPEFIRILSLKSFGCKRKQNIGCSRGFFSHFSSKFNDLLNVAIVSTTLCQKRRFFNLKLHNKNHITPRALHLFFLMIKSYTLSLGLVQGTT